MTIDSRGTARPLEEVGLTLATNLTLFEGFIAQRILPAFESRLAAGILPFAVYDRRVYTADRDAEGNFRTILSEVGATKFQCGEFGLDTPLKDADVRIYGDRARAQQHKATQVALSLLTAREVAAANLLFSTATFTGDNLITVANGKEWGAASTEIPAAAGLPVTDISLAIGRLEDRGFPRERLRIFMPTKTARIFSRNAEVLAQARSLPAYANLGANAIPAVMPAAVIAAIFGVKEVIIPTGVKDTSNRAKSSVFAPIWDPEKVLIAYVSETDTDDAGLGRTIVSSEGMERSPLSAAQDLPSDAGLLFYVDEYRNEKGTADMIRVREQSSQKVTNVAAGELIDNCLS